MENIYLAFIIATILIVGQYFEIRKERKRVKHWKRAWWLVAREQVLLEKEMKLMRKANSEMYNTGFNDGQVASIKKIGKSIVDDHGKLHIHPYKMGSK